MFEELNAKTKNPASKLIVLWYLKDFELGVEIKDSRHRIILKRSIKLERVLKLNTMLKEAEKFWTIRTKASREKIVNLITLVPQYINILEITKP